MLNVIPLQIRTNILGSKNFKFLFIVFPLYYLMLGEVDFPKFIQPFPGVFMIKKNLK